MPHSHHSHSGQFCRHAKDSLEDVIKEAIRQGFEVFGLSEHAPRYRMEDLFPEEADMTPSDLMTAYQSFLSAASSLRTACASQISLLISIETDYITPLDSSNLTRILEQHHEIDYIVGSVHHVNGISIDFDRPTWLRAVQAAKSGIKGRTMDPGPPPTLERGDPNELSLADVFVPDAETLVPFLEAYFDAQYELIQAHKPEVLGHIDLCLLWTPDVEVKGMKNVWERIERNVRAVIDYGGLFEANAAAIRKGWATSYPSKDILRLILSLGGHICLSDDSHGVSYVGLNYLKMRDYLLSEDVHDIWYLVPSSNSKASDGQIGDRRRVAARRITNWDAEPFWKRLEAAQN